MTAAAVFVARRWTLRSIRIQSAFSRSASVPIVLRPRWYSSNASSALSTTTIAQQHRLPVFYVPSTSIRLIEHPKEYYAHLLAIIRQARRRIFLASLYIGKGETELIRHLAQAVERNPDVQLTILVDGLRSTREGVYTGSKESESCASLLAALQARCPDRIEVRAFRAAGLPDWLERIVGKRFVEGYGLQHMKLYGNEQEVMFSGANLSNDYFTNRRDRYMSIRDEKMSRYGFDLLRVAGRFSYSLQAHRTASEGEWHAPYRLTWDEGKRLGYDEQSTGSKDWTATFQRAVEEFTRSWHEAQGSAQEEVGAPVSIVPLVQMGPMNIRQETVCIPMVLEAANRAESRLDFTTGYFSLNPLYAKWILKGQFSGQMITAAPQANGFYGSKGISRHLPAAYTWLEHRFWRKLVRRKRDAAISIREWDKPGWTYHAKGIWSYPPRSATPTLSLLGSSNFGIRSAKLDLECTLLIDATHSAELQKRLGEEVKEIQRDATDEVGETMFARPERKVHWGVKVAAWCIQRML